MIDLFSQKGLLPAFKETYWPYGLSERGKAEERRYLKLKSEFARSDGDSGNDESTGTEPGVDPAYEEFALESHLRFSGEKP